MEIHIKKYLTILSAIFVVTSCFKEDLSKISDNYIWEPDVSVPIFEDDYFISDTRFEGDITNTYPDNNIEYIPITKNFDLSFTDIFDNPDYIKNLALNLGVENYIPSEINIYIDFKRNPNEFIKTLEIDPEIIIPAAIINSNGEVTKSQSFTQLIPINIEDENIIQNTEFITLEIRLTNREVTNEIIANLDNYFCNCSIGVKAELEIPINE